MMLSSAARRAVKSARKRKKVVETAPLGTSHDSKLTGKMD